VQSLALAGKERGVHGLREELVAEAKDAVRLVGREHVPFDRVAQRLRQFELAQGHDRGEEPVLDVPPGGGRNSQDGAAVRVEVGDAGEQHVTQRRR